MRGSFRFSIALHATVAAACMVLGMIAFGVPDRTTAQSVPESYGPDIHVVAQKLRQVNLDYGAFGPWLKRCDITRSSGDPQVDRFMCSLLQVCLKEGHRGPVEARECVNGKLDFIESETADGREPSLIPQWMDEAAERIPPGEVPSPAAIEPIAGPKSDEIFIRGTRRPLATGEWEITESWSLSTYAMAAVLPVKPKVSRVCQSDATARHALQTFFHRSSLGDNDYVQCAGYGFRIKGDRLKGIRSCRLIDRSDTVRAPGAPTAPALMITYTISGTLAENAFDAEVYSRTSKGDRSSWTLTVTGKRVGECEAAKEIVATRPSQP